MGLKNEEGPVGLVLCPSRELARQIHDLVQDFICFISEVRSLKFLNSIYFMKITAK